MASKIFYFCYGSNMLTKRMLINNKSAVRYSVGTLDDYRLCFSGSSNFWKGATANIIPSENSSVIGVVYTLDVSDVEKLDKQEVGYDAIDVPVKVDVNLNCENPLICRTYVQKQSYKDGNELPSKLYKLVIIKGAQEHNLPVSYIKDVIEKFPDNSIVDCGPSDLSIKDLL